MDILLDTVRDEIGACLETSYDQISVKESQNRLNFKTDKEMLAFGDKVSIICIGQTLTDSPSVIYVHYIFINIAHFFLLKSLQKKWKLNAKNVYCFENNTEKPKEPLPSLELAEQAISYARELEMIV